MANLTFVTAFLNIYEVPFENKDIEWRFQHFEKIAKTGVHICLYTDSQCYETLCKLLENYDNVKLMDSIDLEDTFCYKAISSLEYTLPDSRNLKKDTMEYIVLQNSKTEFMYKAIQSNPWNSTHFAWIDFSVGYIIKNMDSTLEYIKLLSKRQFISKIFAVPGCWQNNVADDLSNILNNINWRFCGGFSIADILSIKELHSLYETHFKLFIMHNKKLIWEVNFWAWLEANGYWKPHWYAADHNDRIFNIPTQFCARLLEDKIEKINYNYPEIENFKPSSPSYLYHNGEHLLNTRYVNYRYSPSGSYLINHEKNTLITKNIVSVLDDEFLPKNYNEMNESIDGLTNYDAYSVGLEDIRLYSFKNEVKFIATNVNYVGNRTNRIIIGNYDTSTFSYTNCRILNPPTITGCEKNWIPIIKENREHFIHKWSPYEIGRINMDNNQLEIIESYEIKSPDFHRIRGSTIFIDYSDSILIGVVHFCEETMPRQYYHILVLLDKESLKPFRYSDPFCFQHIGVEFCIGFTIKNDQYIFWVSKKDNDAVMVSIKMDEIPISYDIKY